MAATVLTTVGKGIVTAALVAYASVPKYVAWGTGTNGAVVGDTALQTEQGSRVAGTASQQLGSVANDTFRVTGTQTAGGALAITEAGTFTAATGPSLFVRGDFAAINVGNGDSIAFTFDVKFT